MTILRSLSGDSMSKNKIWLHTGVRWNKPIFEAIKDLQKAGLVTEDKKVGPKHERKHRKIGKPQTLTPLGREMLNVILLSEDSKKNISKLKHTINEKILFIQAEHLTILNDLNGFLYQDIMRDKYSQIVTDKDIAILRRKYEYKLKDFDWYDKEIEFYNECRTGVVNFIVFCEQYYNHILLLRYAWILHTYTVNKKAREITNEIILYVINESVKYNLENIKDQMLGYGAMFHNTYFPIDYIKYRSVGGMDDLFNNLYRILTDHPIPHIIYNEVKDLLVVYLAFLKPYAIGLKGEIDSLEHVTLPQEIKMKVNQKFPIRYTAVTSIDKEVIKTNQYQELINENKRFIVSICKEYYENNQQISDDIERLIPLAFNPDLSSHEYEFFKIDEYR
jgi:hypothetical protein